MRFIRQCFVEVVNIAFALMIALFIFTALRDHVIQPFQVSGHSMEQTLQHGDQMFMTKWQAIERFDIVVFPDPRGSGESYVKRVIGMPGDELWVEADQLYINGQPVAEPYLDPLKNQQANSEPFTEDFSLWDTLGIHQIPADYYFVMGDNRPHSGDSRQFGLVPAESIEGHADIIYAPSERRSQVPSYSLEANGHVSQIKP
ncbi:signal peptidase I [Suicoccus acidiformans]|uniref:Signal peptidase I n=1 Tax=Suicoccus acidiformans TaxID=2036206 RepID=A0A347WKH0_9LACT|nr:signal peptidase I [Suicoccus acidiformans]AXY25577.1 signal peptidase I [Suicoccus acidiformans]